MPNPVFILNNAAQPGPFASAAVASIYYQYIVTHWKLLPEVVSDALPNSDIEGYCNFKNYSKNIAFYEKNEEHSRKLLRWFYENREIIENWYKEEGLSYKSRLATVMKEDLAESLVQKTEHNFFNQKEYLKEVLLPYDFIEAATQFYPNLGETQSFEKANQLAIKEIARITLETLLPIISDFVDDWIKTNPEPPTDKNVFINRLLHLSLESTYRTLLTISSISSAEILSQKEKASIALFVTQIKFSVLPKISVQSDQDVSIALNELREKPENALITSMVGLPLEKEYSKYLTSLERWKRLHTLLPEKEKETTCTPMYIEDLLTKAVIDTLTKKISDLVSDKTINSSTYMTERKKIDEVKQKFLEKSADFEKKILFYHHLKDGQNQFGLMFDSPSPIDILRAYLWLSFHKNKIAGKDNTLLTKLLDCTYGDIENRHDANEASDVKKESSILKAYDLKMIYKQNSEVKDYLTIFKDVFDFAEPLKDSDTTELCAKNYQQIKDAMLHCDSSSSISTILSSDSGSDSDNKHINKHDQRAALAYCYSTLDFFRKSTTLTPAELGRTAALNFFIDANSPAGGTGADSFIRREFNHLKLTKKNQQLFLQQFAHVFIDTEQLGSYDRNIDKIMQTDSTFSTLLLVQHCNKNLNIAEKIKPGAESYTLLPETLLKIINKWEKKLQSYLPSSLITSFSIRSSSAEVKLKNKINKYEILQKEMSKARIFLPLIGDEEIKSDLDNRLTALQNTVNERLLDVLSKKVRLPTAKPITPSTYTNSDNESDDDNWRDNSYSRPFDSF